LRIAARIGQRLRGGEIIELISDLGGGKTAFVRGMVHGAGSTDNVASPTFTISREYHTPRFFVHHFDFYRLSDAGVIAEELAESLSDPLVVTVVEWGNVVNGVLPPDRLKLTIRPTGEHSRELYLTYPQKYAYLVEDL
jgi:tRNA threonylcarbamoyladenosine biosynthesis protein TsaE